MKTIICPIDFSEASLTAADYAVDMACVVGTNVALVHVCPLPVSIAEVPVPPFPFEELVSDAETKIASLKDKLLFRCGERISIFTEVRQGYIIPEITGYCEKIQPYAVVMGAERAGGLERLISGASTFAAITQLSWPVIVVPANAKFSGIRKIGVACDLKDVADTLPVKQIKKIVLEFNAELHVLHVDAGEKYFTPKEVAESGSLQQLIGDLDPVYHFMEGKDVEETICDFADAHDFDLLFVFPKKRSLLSRLWHRSRSKKLVLQSAIPVLALHAE